MSYDVRAILGDYALPSLWALRHRYLDGRPMQFYSKKYPRMHRPFQVQIADDWSPTIVVKKARQMGLTELFINKQTHLSTLVRTVSVYTLPKDRKAVEIAKTRIHVLGKPNHPARFDDYVTSRFINWRSLTFKQYIPLIGGGESILIVTGSWSEDIGESTACDVAYLDEFDRMKPGVVTAFKMSLRSSKLGALRIFSTPTFPDRGVDEQIKATDGKRWMWKCGKCGHWQHLSRDNIMQVKGQDSLISRLETHDKTAHFEDGTFIIGCLKCRQELDRLNSHAQWVAERPGVSASGYSMSQLDCAWITGDTIMKDLRDQEEPGLRQWYNYSLGEGYAGDSGRLSEGLAYTLVDPDVTNIDDGNAFRYRFRTRPQIVVGIDWGKSNWFHCMGRTPEYKVPITLDLEMFTDTENPDDTVNAACRFIDKWKADVIVADNGYGQDRNPKLRDKYGDKFMACDYPPAGSRFATSKPVYDRTPIGDPVPLVFVGRAPWLKRQILKLSQEPRGYRIASSKSVLKYLDIYDLHIRGVTISPEQSARGELVDEAITLGPDHFLHTTGYCDLAFTYLDEHSMHDIVWLDAPDSLRDPNSPEQVDSVLTIEDVVDTFDIFGM